MSCPDDVKSKRSTIKAPYMEMRNSKRDKQEERSRESFLQAQKVFEQCYTISPDQRLCVYCKAFQNMSSKYCSDCGKELGDTLVALEKFKMNMRTSHSSSSHPMDSPLPLPPTPQLSISSSSLSTSLPSQSTHFLYSPEMNPLHTAVTPNTTIFTTNSNFNNTTSTSHTEKERRKSAPRLKRSSKGQYNVEGREKHSNVKAHEVLNGHHFTDITGATSNHNNSGAFICVLSEDKMEKSSTSTLNYRTEVAEGTSSPKFCSLLQTKVKMSDLSTSLQFDVYKIKHYNWKSTTCVDSLNANVHIGVMVCTIEQIVCSPGEEYTGNLYPVGAGRLTVKGIRINTAPFLVYNRRQKNPIIRGFSWMSKHHPPVLALEHLILSPFTFKVPIKFLECLIASCSEKGSDGNTLEARRREIDVNVRVASFNDAISEYSIYDAELCEGNGRIKKSEDKKSSMLRFIATNMFLHVISYPSKTNLSYVFGACCTMGCFAAHSLGLTHGLSGIREMWQKKNNAARALATAENIRTYDGNIYFNVGYASPELQSVAKEAGKLAQQLEEREAVVYSQALSALITIFAFSIQHFSSSSSHSLFFSMLAEVGFLFQGECLLSTKGKEASMIEDAMDAVHWLNRVSFSFIQVVNSSSVLDTSSRSHLRIVNNAQGDQKPLHRAGVTIHIGVPTRVYKRLPQSLRENGKCRVTAVLFSQGINEAQTVANVFQGSRLQDELNMDSTETLCRYMHTFKTFIDRYWEDEKIQDLVQDINNLKELVRCSSNQKNADILLNSAQICKKLMAGRVIFCKSGKDRTGMSVTYDEILALRQEWPYISHTQFSATQVVRERGVRRYNTLLNTSRDTYAFNKLQQKFLPEIYRPPAYCCVGNNHS